MSESSDRDPLLPSEEEEIRGHKHAFRVIKLIGRGGYGAVFRVTRQSDGKKFAMKIETKNARKAVLGMDLAVLRGARAIKSQHFCTVEDHGEEPQRFKFIVMKLVS